MKKLLSLGLILFTFLQFQPVWADTQADHTALRNLRTQAAKALNAKDFTQLSHLMDKNFTIVTVDNRKFSSLKDFKAYWESLFTGEKALLKSIEVDPTADALTVFITPDVGITYGTSTDTYHFTDGDTRTMKTRWTAVLKKNPDGWKLVSIQFGANLFDNPVLTAATTKAYWYGGGGLIIGLIIGLFLHSRKQKAA